MIAESNEIQLLRDDVYVEILDVSPSDIIIIPDAYKELPVRGLVIATGPGRISTKGTLMPCDVSPGDVIQFYFGGVIVHYPDTKHAIVESKFIQAVIE